MDLNLNTCIEHLNNGLEYKRAGDFNNALKEYNIAKNELPTYKHTYNNIAKIYFADGNKIDKILLNFLTYAHLTLLQDSYNFENIAFANQNGFYNFTGMFLPNKYVSGIYTYQRIMEEQNLGKIYADVNLTFNVGFAYLMRNRDIVYFNEIPIDLITNHQKMIIGKNFEGQVLGDSKYAQMIRNIGFTFLVDNMIDNGNNSETFASSVYFREEYQIDDL